MASLTMFRALRKSEMLTALLTEESVILPSYSLSLERAAFASLVSSSDLLTMFSVGFRASGALKPSFGNNTLLKARSKPVPFFAEAGGGSAAARMAAVAAAAPDKSWRREYFSGGVGGEVWHVTALWCGRDTRGKRGVLTKAMVGAGR
ncbi:hypothetical protein FGB62_171g04 [Gracilaria domingensis]|nr:hypothetical protein FGB62_171g04 [Gracilaria domingensis]